MLHSADVEHHQNVIQHLNHTEKSRTANGINIQEGVTRKKIPNIFEEESRTDNRINVQKDSTPKNIPNVFEEDIFDFIDSLEKQEIETATHDRSKSTNGVNKTPMNIPAWRKEPVETNKSAHEVSWRQKANDATSVQPSKQASQPRSTISNPVKESTIQNGAVLTGAGMKPCPTYEMNNLYMRFPHLNPNKVPNPFESTHSNDVKQPVKVNHNFETQKHISHNAIRGENSRHVQPNKSLMNENRSNRMKKSPLTNSLTSLPIVSNTNVNSDGQRRSHNHRMPARSASSINLAVGSVKSDISNQQRNIQNRRLSGDNHTRGNYHEMNRSSHFTSFFTQRTI